MTCKSLLPSSPPTWNVVVKASPPNDVTLLFNCILKSSPLNASVVPVKLPPSYPCALPYIPKLPLATGCPKSPAVWYEIVCVSNVDCELALFLAFVATVNYGSDTPLWFILSAFPLS